jgi:hypothetical protein
MRPKSLLTVEIASCRREEFGERAVGTLSGRAETALAAKSLETLHLVHEYCRRALMGKTDMNAQATALEDAENDLKRLMDEVSRAMHKAQEAVVRITSKAPAAPTEKRATALPH